MDYMETCILCNFMKNFNISKNILNEKDVHLANQDLRSRDMQLPTPECASSYTYFNIYVPRTFNSVLYMCFCWPCI